MPTGRLNMRRIRDVLRLKFGQALSEGQIAASLGHVPRKARALPDQLPHVERIIEPADTTCPCGYGDMVHIGE